MIRRYAAIATLYAVAIGLIALVVTGATQAIDTSILRTIHTISTSWLDTVMQTLTILGEPVLLGGFCMVLFLYLLSRKRPYEAALFAVAMVGTSVLNIGLKYSIMRDRPALWDVLAAETSYSFPSGHAMGTASLALIVGYLYRRYPGHRLIIGGLAVFAFVIGLSRIYLGVHYPSDVLAGWALSAAWVLTVITVGRLLTERR